MLSFWLRYYAWSLLAIVVILIYFVDSGIDLNDEGFYLQGYNRGQDLFFSTTGFHHIVRALPFSDNVCVNRLYRIFLHVFTAWFLSRAIIKYFRMQRECKVVFCWTFLGNLASFVYAPYSLSYNTINLFLIQISIGLLLFMRVRNRDGLSFLPQFFALLIVLALIVFNKASSGVLLAFIIILYYWFFFNDPFRFKLVKSLVAGLLIAGLSSLLFYLAFGNNISVYLNLNSSNENGLISNQQGAFFHLKQLFYNPVYQSKKQFIFVVALVLVFLFYGRRRKDPDLSVGFKSVSILIILSVFAYYYRFYPYGSGAEIFTVPIFFLVFVGWTSKWLIQQERDSLAVLTLLFLSPFAGFFGSDVAPFEGLNHYAVFFFVLLYILNRNANLFCIRLYFLIASLFIVIRFVFFPFGSPPLNTLSGKVELPGNMVQLKVDEGVSRMSAEFIRFMERTDFDNDPAVFINVSPGLLYLSGYRNYLTVYYNNVPGLNSYLSLVNSFNKSDTLNYVVNLNGFNTDKSDVFLTFVSNKHKAGYYTDTISTSKSWLRFRFRKQP